MTTTEKESLRRVVKNYVEEMPINYKYSIEESDYLKIQLARLIFSDTSLWIRYSNIIKGIQASIINLK